MWTLGEGGNRVDSLLGLGPRRSLAYCKWLMRGLVHRRLHFGCDSTHRVEEKSQISSVAPHAFENTQLSEEDASKTSKLLSRALWVRRSPYRFTFNPTRAKMATNAASYNPSKINH